MISKIADWIRIAGDIDDPTIEKRKQTIIDVFNKIEESNDFKLICGLVAIAASGTNPKNEAQKPIIDVLMSSLCSNNPSLPTDPDENKSTIRACAVVTVGEIAIQIEEDTAHPTDLAVLMSSLFLTSIGLNLPSKEMRVKKALTELISITKATMQKAAEIKRERQSVLSIFAKISPDADVKKVIETTKSALRIIDKQMEIDREELEALWWLRGRFSTILQRAIDEIDINTAAIVCALELADRCLLPSHDAVSEMVYEAISQGRTKKQLQEIETSKYFSSIDTTISFNTGLDSDEIKNIISSFPDIFPISSFLNNSTDKLGNTFARIKKISPLLVARQMFNERISTRLIHNME